MECSIIIPTCNAGVQFGLQMNMLRVQTVSPVEIIVIDSESDDDTFFHAQRLKCVAMSIARNDFSHGGARNQAARASQGEILVFMTQDALPVNVYFLEHLIKPILTGKAAASFGRQIPYDNARSSERFARQYLYPPKSELRASSDLELRGVGACFFSNVAAAVRRDIFMDLGMFDEGVIMNEDMLMCAKFLKAGHHVAYMADAMVYHSHTYSLRQIFQRYFDIGVFFQRNLNFMEMNVSGHGIHYVFKMFVFLFQQNDFFGIMRATIESIAKFAGFTIGKRERFIPIKIKKYLSMHKFYWEKFGRGSIDA